MTTRLTQPRGRVSEKLLLSAKNIIVHDKLGVVRIFSDVSSSSFKVVLKLPLKTICIGLWNIFFLYPWTDSKGNKPNLKFLSRLNLIRILHNCVWKMCFYFYPWFPLFLIIWLRNRPAPKAILHTYVYNHPTSLCLSGWQLDIIKWLGRKWKKIESVSKPCPICTIDDGHCH